MASEGNGKVVELVGSAVLAGLAGAIGIFTGVKVHGVKISDLEKRFDRTDAAILEIDRKVQRIIEREIQA